MKIRFFCISVLALASFSCFAESFDRKLHGQIIVEEGGEQQNTDRQFDKEEDMGAAIARVHARERKRLIEKKNADFQRFIEEDRQMNTDDNAIIDSCKLTAGCRCGMNDSCFAARQRINQRRMDKEDARHRNDAEKRQIEFNKKLSDLGLPPMPPIRDH